MLDDHNSIQTLFIPHLESIMDMIVKNIFRPLPSITKTSVALEVVETGIEDSDLEIDPSWPYIRGIYEIFEKLISNESCDMKIIKPFITSNFISEFLQLFDSNLIEEREFLKSILYKIYAKLVSRRRMIRNAITDLFHILIHEIHKFNGTNELLDIMGSIISGFAIPLKEEHELFFKNIIIPLHKVQTSNLYFDNLSRCSILFLTKNHLLTIPLLDGILRYWPFANYLKEIAFIQELGDVLMFCEIESIKDLIRKLFKRILKCISGNHLQVQERALSLFENEHFIDIVKHYKTLSFGIIVPVISYLAENHWNAMSRESLHKLLELFDEIDKLEYGNVMGSLNKKKYNKTLRMTQPQDERNRMDLKWKNLYKIAMQKYPNLIEPVLPFSESFVLREYNSVYKRIYDKEKYINE